MRVCKCTHCGHGPISPDAIRCPKCKWKFPMYQSFYEVDEGDPAVVDELTKAGILGDEVKESFKMTSAFEISGCRIVDSLGLVSGESVIGTGLISGIASSISDITGSNSKIYADKIKWAKHQALNQMRDDARSRGANAVVAVDFGYLVFGNDMIGISVDGTAVVAEKIEQEIDSPFD